MIDTAGIRARLAAAYPEPWSVDRMPETGECRIIRITDDDGAPFVEIEVIVPGGMHEPEALLIAHAPADLAALLAELDASNAEYSKLRAAAREAYDSIQDSLPNDAADVLHDALELDGAPQDGGVTDPHETSGPPTTDHYPECIARGPRACICDVIGDRIRSGADSEPPITEDQQRGFDTLARWTNMHHMTPSPEGMARIDNGHPVPDVLDAECARLVAHECGWQTQRHLEKLEPEVKP